MVHRATDLPVEEDVTEVRVPVASGLRLAADVRGPVAGPPVVLLHGAGQTRHSWSGTAVVLADRGWHVWSVDQRGHGGSDWARPGDYDIGAFADDVLAIRAALDRPPVLVGASLGGMASLLAVAEAPDQAAIARAVVLVDIAHKVEERGVDRIGSFLLSRPDGFASLEEAAEAVAAYNPGRAASGETSGLLRNLRQRGDGRWVWHWDPAYMQYTFGPRDRFGPPIHPMARTEAAVATLRAPALLVRGRSSDLLSEEGAAEFLRLAPHAEYADVAGAGHMVVGDRNEVFNRAILDFVDRHRP